MNPLYLRAVLLILVFYIVDTRRIHPRLHINTKPNRIIEVLFFIAMEFKCDYGK